MLEEFDFGEQRQESYRSPERLIRANMELGFEGEQAALRWLEGLPDVEIVQRPDHRPLKPGERRHNADLKVRQNGVIFHVSVKTCECRGMVRTPHGFDREQWTWVYQWGVKRPDWIFKDGADLSRRMEVYAVRRKPFGARVVAFTMADVVLGIMAEPYSAKRKRDKRAIYENRLRAEIAATNRGRWFDWGGP